MAFDSFGEAAFESGIVATMLTLTQDTHLTQGYATASYQALSSIINLMRTGTTEERYLLLDECLKHDVVRICLDVSHLNSHNTKFYDYTLLLESNEPSTNYTPKSWSKHAALARL